MNKNHRLLYFIAKVYGAKLVIKKRRPKTAKAWAMYSCHDRTILLYDHEDEQRMLNSLFHELGHDYCVKNNKWVAYHTSECVKTVMKVAWRAETWVDSWAAKEYNRIFPKGFRGVKFEPQYVGAEAKQWLKEYYLGVSAA